MARSFHRLDDKIWKGNHTMGWNDDLDMQSNNPNLMESKNQQAQQRNNRIYIDKSYHSVYKMLTESEESEQPFDSMKNVFMLATFIGYQQKQRIRLKNKVDIFSWDVLARDEENVPLLIALALAETSDVEILTDQGRILDIAEEYANAGIIEIKEKIADRRDNKIMHLVNLLGVRIPDDLITSLAEDVS